MIELLAPLGLAAAAALVVPLAIHLVRRSDRRVVNFSAMRYLRAHAHPRARLRLVRPLLLALRVGLLTGLAILLALPVWLGSAAPSPRPWVVLAPGVDALAARAALRAPLAEWHRLGDGYPNLPDGSDPVALAADTRLAAEPVPINSLLRQLDRDLMPTVALTIVVPETLVNLDAERLQLAHAAAWLPLPGSIPVLPGHDASGTDAPNRASAAPAAPFTIAVRYDAAGASELPVVRALGAAWAADGRTIAWDIATGDVPLPPSPAWVFWLGDAGPDALRARARAGERVLVAPPAEAAARSRDDTGEVVLAAPDRAILRADVVGRGRLLEFTAPLRADALPAVLAPDFAQRLWSVLATPTRIPASAPARSVAPLATARADWAPAESLGPPLAVALALLFLLERLLATRARNGSAA